MLETDVLGVEEGGQSSVAGTAEIKSDIAVEKADRDVMKLVVHETYVLEVGRANDLSQKSAYILQLKRYDGICVTDLLDEQDLDLFRNRLPCQLLFRCCRLLDVCLGGSL